MDTLHPDPPENPDFQRALQAENVRLQADGLIAQQQAAQQGYQPQPIVLFYNQNKVWTDGTTEEEWHTGTFSRSLTLCSP